MEGLKITWDSRKSTRNKWKHGVSFEEAQTVFNDDFARLISDPDHSGDEDRYILLGRSARLRLLIVCHCYREESDTIRIISARKANRSEQKQYEGFGYER
jgi:uncharacterized DUF497 family protein